MANNIGTPYDDVFRTLLAQCPKLIIPVVNEMFGEHFTGDEEVVLGANERMITDGENITKRITDSNFTIGGRKRYHIESQVTDDGTIAFRMVQYDMNIALENAVYSNGCIDILYPSSGIIFLRSTDKTPDEIRIRIRSSGDSLEIVCPTLKVCDYSIDEIFEKELYFLIPFHLFVYEKNFAEYNEDEEKLTQLRNEYDRIKVKLKERMKERPEGSMNMVSILQMLAKVAETLADSFSNIQEGVRGPMFGNIIEDEYYNGLVAAQKKAREKGLEEGREEGREKGLEEGREKGREEGREEGRKETREEMLIKAISDMKDFGISYDVVKSKLFETYGLSEAEAEEYLKEY